MIKHIWSVLCQRSVIDQQSNNISLIDVFEQLQVNVALVNGSKIPTPQEVNIPVQYELINFWSRTKKGGEEKGSIRIVLSDSKGKEIKRIDKELVIPQNKRRMRGVIKIQGIALRGSGVYNFTVNIKQSGSKMYKKVAEIPLEVQISKGN